METRALNLNAEFYAQLLPVPGSPESPCLASGYRRRRKMKIMADDALEVWIHDLGANKPVLDRTLVFALPRGLVSSSEATPAATMACHRGLLHGPPCPISGIHGWALAQLSATADQVATII
jgi:hypothetical protein